MLIIEYEVNLKFLNEKSFLKGIDIFCEIIAEMVAVEIEIDKYPEPGKKKTIENCVN